MEWEDYVYQKVGIRNLDNDLLLRSFLFFFGGGEDLKGVYIGV